jgi:hypothetical protein
MSAPSRRPETLWCPNNRHRRSNGWSYPPAVEKLLRQITDGRTVLQLFGGLSRWGTRLDIDSSTRPHVQGDAWLPPFGRDSFDVVILDPPYAGINQQMKQALIRGAAFVARDHVLWFHTQWVAPDAGMRRERSWLIRVGDSCACRCLIEWRVVAQHKRLPTLAFTRGPALKYRRWLAGEVRLPFPASDDLMGGGTPGVPAAPSELARLGSEVA